MSTSKTHEMKDLHNRARENLTLLAQLAHEEAADEKNHAAV